MGLLRVLTVTAATYTRKQLLELVNESDNNAEKNKPLVSRKNWDEV